MSVVKRIPFCGLLALAAFAQLKTPHGDAPAGALPLLQIDAVVVSPEGDTIVRLGSSGPVSDAESIGSALGEELLAAGGREILEDVYGDAAHG